MKRRKFLHHGIITLAGSGFILANCNPDRNTISNALDLSEITLDALQKMYHSKSLTVSQATQWYLDRISKIDRSGPKINSVIEVNPDALKDANALDAEFKSGKIRSALHGIPVLVKDNIDVTGKMSTSAGSLALKDNKASRDAFIIEKLKSAGAVILGKTNLSEWANFRSSRSSSGWSSRGGQTLNPYVMDRSPCGSSSGSGASVAANLCTIAIGTETDGSIACPSSMCCIVGIKPTVGLWSRSGIIPISRTQDTAGPMARTVKDAAVLLALLSGIDENDPVTKRNPFKGKPDFISQLDQASLSGKRFGIDKTFLKKHEKIDKLLHDTLENMKSKGATIIEVDFNKPNDDLGNDETNVLRYEFKDGINKYLASHPVSSKSLTDLIQYNNDHRDSTMPYFMQETFLASDTLSDLSTPAYLTALKNSHDKAKQVMDDLLKTHHLDALIGPATGAPWCIDKINGDRWTGYGAYGIAAVAGYPSITVPMGFIDELPIGMSFMSTAYDEEKLIHIAYAFEQITKARKPPKFIKTI